MVKEYRIKKYVRFAYLFALALFFLNKLYLRPLVLESELPLVFQIIVLSIPNLIEAVMGTLLVTGLIFYIKPFIIKKIKNLLDPHIYIISVSLTGVFVISQELKFHNLGGNNVYDLNDVIASLLGLLMTFITLLKYGFREE